MDANPRVLHTEWSDGWGGQEIRIISEMISVRDLGVDVFLACRKNSTIKLKAEEHKIKVFDLPFKGNYDLITLYRLIKIIFKLKINIVNTHSGKDTWVGGLAAKLTGAKFIRTRHLSNPINPSKLNFINGVADYIFTTGESVREDMIKRNRIREDRIRSIPTGIDDNLYNPKLYSKNENRDTFRVKKNEIAIGIVAVLRKFKRHDLFVRMAKEIIIKFPDKKFKFLIAGDGPQKEKIFNLINDLNISENVRLLGHVSNVPEFLSALDIFVLSSDSKEGVPQSVMQALLMKKLVVATNCGSTKDLMNKNNFILAKTNSVSSLTNGVSYFIKNQFKDYDRDFIVRNFSKKIMTEKILAIYKLLLENK